MTSRSKVSCKRSTAAVVAASAVAMAAIFVSHSYARADVLNFTHATNTNWDDAAVDLNWDDTTTSTTSVPYTDGSAVTFDNSHGSNSSSQAVVVNTTASNATGVSPASITFINSGGTAGNYTISSGTATTGISGSTGITINADYTGTVNLTSVNTYTGDTIINGGGLRADSGPLPTGTNVILGGGTFSNSSGSSNHTYANNFVVTAGTTTSVMSPSGNTVLNGSLSSSPGATAGGTALTLAGGKVISTSNLSGFTGTLTLSGATVVRLNFSGTAPAGGSATAIFDTGASGTFQSYNGGGSGSSAFANAIPLGALQGTGGTLGGAGHSGGSFYAIGGLGLNTTFAGTINNTNTVGVYIVGGSLSLTGNSNIYAGGTIIQSGALYVNNTSGSATGTGTNTVTTGATLGGNGFITGATTVNTTTSLPTSFVAGGHIAPGSAGATSGSTPGTLTLGGGLTLNNYSNLDFSLNGVSTSTGNDLVSTTDLTIPATSLVQVNFTFAGGSPASGSTYDLINYSGTLTGDPSAWTATGLPGGFTAAFTAPGNGQIDVTFTSGPAVPEPASIGILALGGIALIRRRRSVR